MQESSKQFRRRGAFLELAVGDALGAAVEFMPREGRYSVHNPCFEIGNAVSAAIGRFMKRVKEAFRRIGWTAWQSMTESSGHCRDCCCR